MKEDYTRKSLPLPDEDKARSQYLRAGVAAPDWATVKEFLRFYALTSRPQLDTKKSTTNSLQTTAE
jgi:hypothetical protein